MWRHTANRLRPGQRPPTEPLRSDSPPLRLAVRRLLRPAALWSAACLLLLGLAGCKGLVGEDAERQSQGSGKPDDTPVEQPPATPVAPTDGLPELAIAAASATEADAFLRFTVSLSRAGNAAVAVAYETADGTATAGADYAAASGRLTFPAQSTAARTIAVSVNDDSLDEDTEMFSVTLGSAENAQLAGGGETLVAWGRIEDDDPLPELSIGDASLTEGGGSMRFAVRLDPASGRTVTVQYATADGTATAGADYTATSGTLTLPAGATTATVEVPILDDTAREESETFTVTLSDPTAATLTGAGATGTIANLAALALSFLEVTGAGTMYPPFDADTLHYALACGSLRTVAVAARTERDGAQLTLLRDDSAENAVSTTGNLNARVVVGGNHDVAIEVSDGGNSRTYIVHCLPNAFPTIEILHRTDQVKDGFLLLTPAYGGYSNRTTFMAVLDNNGVPRFHRLLSDTNFWAMDFRPHGGGRFTVARREELNLRDSPFGNWEIDLLNQRLEVTSTLTTVAPLSQTDGHGFQIAANGDYVMLSYYDDEPRDFSAHGGSRNEEVADSVIQRRTAGGTGRSLFTWNSWDHRRVLQWGNDCRVGLFLRAGRQWPPAYAHLNSVQLLADGDFVASFRGCGQVLRIDGATGAVEWKLGGTAPPVDSDAEFLELVEHADASVVEEFCGQHHVSLTSSDTVVMFDNGVQCIGRRKNTSPFSRAVEYDISSGTHAAYLREYRLPAAHGHFPYRGGVHVLEDFGGSVHWLISWGGGAEGRTVKLDKTIAVSEVDPATGTAHLELNLRKGSQDAWSYRAYRIPESEVDIPLHLP